MTLLTGLGSRDTAADLHLVYEELSTDHQLFLPLLLIGYTLLSSIFLLNLLIAQASSKYYVLSSK